MVYTLAATGVGAGEVSASHGVTGVNAQVRLRFLTGFAYVHSLKVKPLIRGPLQMDG
jgi:hypothetical protein